MSEVHLNDNLIGKVVTEIKPLPSNPALRRLYVGSESIVTLRASDVELLDIRPGHKLDKTLAKEINQSIEINRVRKAALQLLGRRSFSSGELRDRLTTKEYDRNIVDDVLTELIDDHWLDDRVYAESIAHELCKTKPASQSFLVSKLLARQIDRDVADQVARQVLSESDPFDRALKFAQKRFSTMSDVSPSTAARRLAGVLSRRGIDEDTVTSILEKLQLLPVDAVE